MLYTAVLKTRNTTMITLVYSVMLCLCVLTTFLSAVLHGVSLSALINAWLFVSYAHLYCNCFFQVFN